MHQGDKLGASDVGELTRSKDEVNLHAHSLFLCCTILMLKPCSFICNSCWAIISTFREGDSIMDKLHNMVKHFSSNITNQKNYDSVLEKHLCRPTNQSEQDHNGTRIVDVHRLLKSSLRLKIDF